MNQSLTITNLIRSTRGLFRRIARFHYIFSICLLIIGAVFTTFYINRILNRPSVHPESLPQSGFSDKFDTETIKRIEKFKYSNETEIPPPPSGRTNPFTE